MLNASKSKRLTNKCNDGNSKGLMDSHEPIKFWDKEFEILASVGFQKIILFSAAKYHCTKPVYNDE